MQRHTYVQKEALLNQNLFMLEYTMHSGKMKCLKGKDSQYALPSRKRLIINTTKPILG